MYKAPSVSPKGGEVILHWATASEQNNDYFTVEASAIPSEGGAFEWKEVGKVKGAGNSSTIQQYKFTFSLPFGEGGVGFRLKQTDYDGKYEYFGPISVNFSNCNTNIINVLPTISSNGYFTVVGKDEAEEISIYDLLGQKVFSVKNGTFPIAVDLSVCGTGVYLIQIKMGEFIKNTKLIINK